MLPFELLMILPNYEVARSYFKCFKVIVQLDIITCSVNLRLSSNSLLTFTELGNQIEVLTVGEGDGSGEEEEESVPVCSVGRDASTDDICADAAVAPLNSQSRRDLSPTQENEVGGN